MSTKTRRWAVLSELMTQGFEGTQSQLVGELKKRGIKVTQATVSRDLEELGAARKNTSDGTVYGFSQQNAPPLQVGNRLLRDLILTAEACGTLVVIKTYPGMAPSIAAAIDGSMQHDVIGTVAGDDTVFAVTRRANEVAAALRKGSSS